MRDPGLYQGGDNGIGPPGFGTIEEFEAAHLQVERSELFEVDKGLLDERIRVVLAVTVCGVIGRAETELAERRRRHRIIGQPYNRNLLAFKQPIDSIASLSE